MFSHSPKTILHIKVTTLYQKKQITTPLFQMLHCILDQQTLIIFAYFYPPSVSIQTEHAQSYIL